LPSPPPHIRLHDWALLVLLSLLWGGSYLFVGIAVRDLPPLVIVMARVVIAAAALLPLHLVLAGPLPRGFHVWRAIAVMSVINNVIPFTLIVTGQTMIASGLASVINATAPLFSLCFIAAAGLERLAPRKLAGIVTGIAGVAVLKGGTLLGEGSQSLGILLCLGAAASYGLATLWARLRLAAIPPLSFATGQLLCSAAIMTGLAAGFSHPEHLLTASAASWTALLGLALMSTAFAYIIFFRIVASAGAGNVLLVTMMIPVSAIAFGVALLGETLEPREIAGAAIIALALLIIDGRPLRWFRKPSA
jgi:drug/metabolite transporter (DMT)-like permease